MTDILTQIWLYIQPHMGYLLAFALGYLVIWLLKQAIKKIPDVIGIEQSEEGRKIHYARIWALITTIALIFLIAKITGWI